MLLGEKQWVFDPDVMLVVTLKVTEREGGRQRSATLIVSAPSTSDKG